MWPQGSFLAPVSISSLQMMQTLSTALSSSGVASGYSVFMLRMARRERITSFRARLNDLMVRYMGLMMNSGKVCILIMMIMNTAYKTTLTNPIQSSVYNRYIALFSHGFSDCKSTV